MGKSEKKGAMADESAAQTAEKAKKMLANREYFAHSIKRMKLEVDEEQAASKIAYEEQLKSVDNYMEKFEEVCVRIHAEAFFKDEELTQFMRDNGKIAGLGIEIKTLLREKIDACENKDTITSGQGIADAVSIPDPPVVQSEKSMKINCTNFDGNFQNWFSFEQCVSQAMKENENASEEEKFEALLNACSGQPKNLINFFKGSFTKAFATLEVAYGSAYKQTSSALAKLMAIPHCMNARYEETSRLLNEALICENSIERSGGMDNFQYAFASIIIGKFSTEGKRAWERERSTLAKSWAQEDKTRKELDHLPTWTMVKNYLQTESVLLASEAPVNELACKSNPNKPTYSNVVANSSQTSQHSINDAPTPSTSREADQRALALQNEKIGQPIWLQCKLCPGIHPTFGCSEYNRMSLDRKEDFVWRNTLCVRCLRPNHEGDCVDPKCNLQCPKCRNGSKHNSTLCPTTNRR